MPTAGNDGSRGVFPEPRRKAQPGLRLNRGVTSCGELDPWRFNLAAGQDCRTHVREKTIKDLLDGKFSGLNLWAKVDR